MTAYRVCLQCGRVLENPEDWGEVYCKYCREGEMEERHDYLDIDPDLKTEEWIDKLQIAVHGALSIVEMRYPEYRDKLYIDTTDVVTLTTTPALFAHIDGSHGDLAHLVDALRLVLREVEKVCPQFTVFGRFEYNDPKHAETTYLIQAVDHNIRYSTVVKDEIDSFAVGEKHG